MAEVGGWVVTAGGTVLLSSRGALLAHDDFRSHAFGSGDPVPSTLAHGQRPAGAGWHVMRMPGTDWTEAGSGLGAAGAHLLLAHVCGGTVSGQRLLPVVQVTSDPSTYERFGADLDGVVAGSYLDQARGLLEVVVAVASATLTPRTLQHGDVGFQVTRGLLGTSM
jgi:altronate dehydratase